MARRKKKLSPIYVVSLAVHVAIGAALAFIPQARLREVVAIALNDAPKEEKKPEPPKPPPRAAEPPHTARAGRAPRTSAPIAATAEASNAPAFTDLGLTLDSSSSDGLAVNIAPAAVRPPSPPPSAAIVSKPKLLVPRRTEGSCVESLVKARPLSVVRPSYTEEARHARVEGRVRIELSVDEHGEVTGARVLDGLGYGLDEAAVAAAKRLHFSAATQCGRAVGAPFVIAMRFQLGS